MAEPSCSLCAQPLRGTDRPALPCQWHRDEYGNTMLIPGCWPRVHDPDADCLCGRWSEATAAEAIRGYRATVNRALHDLQTLRDALHRAGIADPTMNLGWQTLAARQRRRKMHKTISEAGGDHA